jgi:hypothetical protein
MPERFDFSDEMGPVDSAGADLGDQAERTGSCSFPCGRTAARWSEPSAGAGATLAGNLPGYIVNRQTFEIEGKPAAPDDREPIGFFGIGSNYFGVISAAAISGREFDDGDRRGSLPVALVNRIFAERFLPGENPIGKRLRSTARNRPNDWLRVVGVVPNIMQNDPLRQQFKPLVYVPLRQRPPGRVYFLVRTRMTMALAGTIRAEVQKIDSDVSFEELMTLKAHIAFDRDSNGCAA